MNTGYIVIVETVLLIPLAVWGVVRMCRKEDAKLAVFASLVTLFIQCVASFIFREHITAEPILFFMAFMHCQALVIFQMETVKRLRLHFLFFRTQPVVISVAINSLAYTIPWWLLTGCLLKRFSEM